MAHSREPIKNTCPDIDKYIKSIKNVLVLERNLNGMEYDDLYINAVDMANELESCIDYLESLRDSNASLREWGIKESERVDECERTIYELECKIEELNT